MSLLASYRRFLEAPTAANLSDDASMYYITTTTAVHGRDDIIKHLNKTSSQLKKHRELVLSAVESTTTGGLAVETDTNIEFLTSGGPYLPSLDDNFLADRKVDLPITHFVTFNGAGKITQIRLCWDQGALLKQIDVIGKSGRNWPIRDAPEQVKMIVRAVAVGGNGMSALPTSTLAVRSREQEDEEDDEAEAEAAPTAAARKNNQSSERYYRPDPKRYDHFDLADRSAPESAPKPGAAPPKPKPQHTSQWSFEQFSEQQEPRKPRGQDVRHFGIENDEFPETPSAARRKQAPARPRPDAEPHFEFQDDGEPTGNPRAAGRPRGAGQNAGQGLYENNLYKEDGTAPTPVKRPQGTSTHKERNRMYESNYLMNEPESPDAAAAAAASDDRRKAVQKLEANWATDLDDQDAIPGTNVRGKGVSERGITIGGDGMGGKKSGRSWSFGGDDDEDAPAPVPEKKVGKARQASDFWDY